MSPCLRLTPSSICVTFVTALGTVEGSEGSHRQWYGEVILPTSDYLQNGDLAHPVHELMGRMLEDMLLVYMHGWWIGPCQTY